ncbi:hypothetical protein ACVCKN_28230, partial [Klebsiella pneumoniae]
WVNEANKFGLETLCELMLAILDDVDLRDWQTRHNLETLAERAGLATRSDGGHKSISRASRGCDRLYWLNAIITDKAPFNPYDARCACKHIEVTEDFFAILGIGVWGAMEPKTNVRVYHRRSVPSSHAFASTLQLHKSASRFISDRS